MTASVYTAQYRRFRELLLEARKSKGLSQTDLAENLDCQQTFVSKYERGERRLDVVEFLRIATALELDPVEVLKKIEEETLE